LRILYILPSTHPTRPLPRKRGTPTRLLIVLGSGGHTAEMLLLLRKLDISLYTTRSYIISEGDDFSARRAIEFEAQLGSVEDTFDISTVPRARKIHQPLLTTPISALRCLLGCFLVLGYASRGGGEVRPLKYPDLVLTNGPGTAVCIILACLALRFFGVRGTKGTMRTVYVESWARVKGLSLSGKLLVRLVDRFLVQWEGLQAIGGRSEFLGVLV
ncbi:MAG: UDP-N-acetylglucosamine transferase subunit, partial [Candelina submexicana]